MNSPSKLVIKRDIKTSMTMLLRSDKNLNIKNQKFSNEYVLRQTGAKICKQLEVLGWRFKTSLPIIKPLSFKIYQFQQLENNFRNIKQSSFQLNNGMKGNNEQISSTIFIKQIEQSPNIRQFDLQIRIEEIKYRLSQLDLLPFNQIIYLLKEMMIGYDVLLDIFGTFDPNDQMIALNQNFQWGVWINQNYHLNKKSQIQNEISQKEFIYKLIFIAQKHCNATNQSRGFFQEIKQFTYNKQCNFVRILQKIKDFASVNKIYPVNRVTFLNDRKQKETNINPASNLKKKLSYNLPQKYFGQTNQVNNKSTMFNFNKSTSTINLMNSQNRNTGYTNVFKEDSNTSGTFMGNMSINLTPKNNCSRIISPGIPLNKQSSIKFGSLQQLNNNFGRSNNPEKILIQPKNIEYKKNFSKIFQQKCKISQILQESNSYVTKGRHQLKAIINSHNYRNNKSFLSPQPIIQQKKQEKKKKVRKYSQQIVKFKSAQLMNKKFSNIFNNEPESYGQINVIKKNEGNKPNKRNQTQQFCNNNNYDSSPSTKEIQKSNESRRNNKMQYLNAYSLLKQKDLEYKSRNNQSSYYGINGQSNEEDSKHMTVSFNYQNKNQNTEQKSNGSGWAKKISGLFSDDASIKQLKESVTFKTKEQKYFEKEYLKDVKLDLLQKFGRQVRHSIADEDDNYLASPYKSMQLIEEVLDEGKSFVEKEDICGEQPQVIMRKRNQTVQVQNKKYKNDQKDYEVLKPFQIKSIECQSRDVSSERDSDQGFNFQPQEYSLFKII